MGELEFKQELLVSFGFPKDYFSSDKITSYICSKDLVFKPNDLRDGADVFPNATNYHCMIKDKPHIYMEIEKMDIPISLKRELVRSLSKYVLHLGCVINNRFFVPPPLNILKV